MWSRSELNCGHLLDSLHCHCHCGADAAAGEIVDMKELGVWEPLMVKTQTFKTAIEAGELGLCVSRGGTHGCVKAGSIHHTHQLVCTAADKGTALRGAHRSWALCVYLSTSSCDTCFYHTFLHTLFSLY